MTSTDTSWIVPGAPIAVYRSSRLHGDDHLRMTTVAKVAAKSFTVDGVDERFQLATMACKRSDFSQYRAVAPDAQKVAEIRAREAQRRAMSAAMQAVEDWNMGTRRANPERVQAAIDALTALRDTL